MWGTVRSRIYNIIYGVSHGFIKELQLNGVGYKATPKGKVLELLLGYSHPINFEIPEDLKIEVPKPTEIKISGIINKELVKLLLILDHLENLSRIKAKVLNTKMKSLEEKKARKNNED